MSKYVAMCVVCNRSGEGVVHVDYCTFTGRDKFPSVNSKNYDQRYGFEVHEAVPHACPKEEARMKHGDRVEVNKVWASNGRLQAPSRGWFGGYEFVSTDGHMTRVTVREGVFRDCVAVYPARCVRGVSP